MSAEKDRVYRSEKNSSQLLISACDLLAFVFIWPSVLLF